MIKSRVVLLPSLLLVMLVPLMALASSGCGKDNDTSGKEVWMRQFGTSGDDRAWATTSDGSGNIYVAGQTDGTFPGQISLGNYDVFIAKYDISGKEVWTKQFGSSGYDYACAVVADGSGNIYVAGYTSGTFPGQTSSGDADAFADAFIAKFDTSGNEVWTRQFGTSGDDRAWAMTSDGSGNIYVAGQTDGTFPGQTSSGEYDAFIAKYDTLGNEVWTRQFGSSVLAVIEDGSGNIYVAGDTIGVFSGQTSLGNYDAFIAKYDTLGNEVWTRQFGSSDNDYVSAIFADGSGNIYVAGYTGGTLTGQTSSGNDDVFIAKYDTSGNEVWTKQFGTSDIDYAKAMVTDGSGNIYVAGLTSGTFTGQTSSGNDDVFIAKYDTSGNKVWTRQFGTSDWDSAASIAADGSGNIYVAGDTLGVFPGQISYGYSDAFVAKYDTLGNEVWTRQFDFNNNDKVSAMVVDGSEYIYMVGTTGDTLPGETSSGNSDAFIMKLLK